MAGWAIRLHRRRSRRLSGWSIRGSSGAFGERLLKSTLIFQGCFQADAIDELIGSNDKTLVAVIHGRPVLSGGKERQKLGDLLLLLGLLRTGFGFHQVFEGLAAITKLVIAKREIVGEHRLESLQLHAFVQDRGGFL